jgi:hypothetical protein
MFMTMNWESETRGIWRGGGVEDGGTFGRGAWILPGGGFANCAFAGIGRGLTLKRVVLAKRARKGRIMVLSMVLGIGGLVA